MDREQCPWIVPAPGEILQDEIEARGWTLDALATMLEEPVEVIQGITFYAQPISKEIALKLSEIMGTSPDFWINLETSYRNWLAVQSRKEAVA